MPTKRGYGTQKGDWRFVDLLKNAGIGNASCSMPTLLEAIEVSQFRRAGRIGQDDVQVLRGHFCSESAGMAGRRAHADRA